MTISDPIHRQYEVKEPVLLELIQTPAVQRLKGVDVSLPNRFMEVPWGTYTRFDHCLGVMCLIGRLGGSLEEQIAGLLHDISHTAFAHAMDYVFDRERHGDFHEDHIARIVFASNLGEILHKYSLNIDKIVDPKNFSILEQDLPALCADRIDYALRAFHKRKLLSLKTIHSILAALQVGAGKIVFADSENAQKFAHAFLQAEMNVWDGNALEQTKVLLFSRLVRQAYEEKRITLDDFLLPNQNL